MYPVKIKRECEDNNIFLKRLEETIDKHLKGQNVGFLLGAGSSYLDGDGYPLSHQFWPLIKDDLPKEDFRDIQLKLDEGASGLEHALDLLDKGSPDGFPLRFRVAKIISDKFQTIKPPLDVHRLFLRKVSTWNRYITNIFSLNYDPLVELSATSEGIYLVDGFVGHENAYFHPIAFTQVIGLRKIRTGREFFEQRRDVIHLHKLHGSIGWFLSPDEGPRRHSFYTPAPDGVQPLMIPPEYRKAQETGTPPYSSLWSGYRAKLIHGPELLNRLISFGYGMQDEHVNHVIENALARDDFTLLIIAKELPDESIKRWGSYHNVVIVTEGISSMDGHQGPGHPELWSFENIVERM